MIGPALRPVAAYRGATSLARSGRSGRFLPNGWRDFWFQVAVMSTFAIAYEAARMLARGDHRVAVSHANSIVAAERSLGVFVELDIQRWALNAPSWVIGVANWTYLNCQFTVTFAVVLWVYLRRNASYARLRNTILGVDLLGVIGYLAYPAAPPRILGGIGFVDTLNQASVNHHSGPIAALSNPYAAMPSLHTAYALVIGATAVMLVRSRWLRAIWALYPALVVFSVIATGNHFVLDALAGAAAALVAAGLVAAAPGVRRASAPVSGRHVAAGSTAVGILAFASWRVSGNVPQLAGVLTSAAPALLLAALAANFASVLLKASVWKLTLEAVPKVGRVTHRTLVPPLFIGYLCNTVLVLRLGDLARIAEARRRLRASGTDVPMTVVAGSAIAEQLILGLALVVLGLTFALVVASPPIWISLSLVATAIGIAACTLVITRAHGWHPRQAGHLARAAGAGFDILGHSRYVLRSRSAFALAFLAGIAAWGCQMLGIYVLLLAFDLPHGLTASAAVFLASTCVGLVPLIPGNIGVFPVAISAALAPVGVGIAEGASFGLALQTVEVLLGAGLGLVFAITSGTAWRDLVRRKPYLKPLPAPAPLEDVPTSERRIA
jgi:uncharacterized membrane protein YbhN (UPF0104 family)